MWLSADYLIVFISFIQGLHILVAQHIEDLGDPCVAKILSCNRYKMPFSNKEKDMEMFKNIKDLNKACLKQAAYTKCIVRAENLCRRTMLLSKSEEMIKSSRFAAEICRPASPWQQLYLKEASCLNAYSKEALADCIEKTISTRRLDHAFTSEHVCKYGGDIIDCSAVALQEKCGYYAGNILKKFIKFHSFSYNKCFDYTLKDVEDSFSLTQDYDITETIFNAIESKDSFARGVTEKTNEGHLSFKDKTLYPENQISLGDLQSEEAVAIFNIDTVVDEYVTEYSFAPDAKSKDVIQLTDKLEFPSLPKHNYVHKNRTTFAIYEDFEMGHMKYMGCGAADFFWIILSPLKSKFCILSDLKLEYSEAIFKCTVLIDSPCSPELDDDDRYKKADLFHRRYVITVLTPPNNQQLDDMAVMNVLYLKLYPSPSMHVPEKKANLWTTGANEASIEQTEPVRRMGTLEWEDDPNDILDQNANGSGRKWNEDSLNDPFHSDEDEYELWDYYPLEKEDDLYFPELLSNDIIYIEDDEGDLISLHDQRSPIYKKSLYEPRPLFRPQIAAVSTLNYPRREEIETNWEKQPFQNSVFKKRISDFRSTVTASKSKPNQQEHCSIETPCTFNSESTFEFGIKPGMYIPAQSIGTFDPLKGISHELKKIPSSTNLNFDMKSLLSSEDFFGVTPSTKIEVPISTKTSKKT